jgi:hypothetical protein
VVRRFDLALGVIELADFVVQRSGLRWLVPDHHPCRAGEVVAYCNIGLSVRPGSRPSRMPFAEEVRDFQLTLAPSLAGILHQASALSLGGDLDQLHFYQSWDPREIAASIEVTETPDLAPAWHLGFAAGRRMTELAEDRSGLLTGWHSRRRAWSGERGPHITVLSLGICEQNGIFRGERNGFLELLDASPAPLHVVHVADEALVPSAAVLSDILKRDAAANEAIAADMAHGLLSSGVVPTPADFIFAGCALAALTKNPLQERFDLLTREGLVAPVPVQAVVLSIHSEPGALLRHRRLGYRAYWHRFRTWDAGPAMREWLQTAFEPVKRSLADIGRDLVALRAALTARGVEHILVINAMSSSGHEDIVNYAAFSGALSDTVVSIRAKEVNLMLHDIAATADIAIVDADAIAAAIGGGAHLPDGVHQSRLMQAETRAEILHILRERGLFAPYRQLSGGFVAVGEDHGDIAVQKIQSAFRTPARW